MFEREDLATIEAKFKSGLSADEVAALFGMSRNTFILRLAKSGKQIRTYRRLEDIVPVEMGKQRREVIAA